MLAFAHLLDQLLLANGTLTKIALMRDYFRKQPDPERGFALAALAGSLSFPLAKPKLIRDLITTRVDPVLYTLSRDYVGDMAETVSLMWPQARRGPRAVPSLEEVVGALSKTDRRQLAEDLAQWLDALDPSGRWALLKLITGNIRIGVSARLAKTALAETFGRTVDDIEQLWHGLDPPYLTLFSWLEGRAEKPQPKKRVNFMPMMLAHPIEPDEFRALDLSEFQIEFKWDGIRVQIVRSGQDIALYSRTGDDISATFPDLADALRTLPADDFVLDGELLAMRDGAVAPFNVLQQRLNRKKVSAQMIREFPVHIRLYDILMDKGEDVRSLSLATRRLRLEAWVQQYAVAALDLSEKVLANNHDAMEALRIEAREDARHGIEGLMIKRLESAYVAGRPRGQWFKWKRNTLTLDCVLMYAQRGSGKRSSFYSDYTFGVWDGDKLVPVGKAYSGFTDAELALLDKWIRGHTVNRFGPVREVEAGLVLEIEFDSIHLSKRHKSGVAMRFPRVHRIRWDKPAAEADHIEAAQGQIVS